MPEEQAIGEATWRDRAVGWLEHHGNRVLRPLGTALFRWRGSRIGPAHRYVLLLTTRGRRSGRPHTVLLQGFQDGDDLVVVAANAGRASHPDWYLNLLAAGTATVELRGERFQVQAEFPGAAERASWWNRILAAAPSYARYRRSTSRDIPLVRLIRGADRAGNSGAVAGRPPASAR